MMNRLGVAARIGRRYASSKPKVLEKPTRFNPPSHPQRLVKHRRYGPALSAEELQAQKTKTYPQMMPPDGSFMHWFLTNRSIHIWITLGTLSSLAIFTMINSFKSTSPFAHMLPPYREIYSHPISFVSKYIEVFKLHTAHKSAETAERRKRKVEDVEKRAEYRKAHGLDQNEGIGGWTAKSAEPSVQAYTDFDGEKKQLKKWLGIW